MCKMKSFLHAKVWNLNTIHNSSSQCTEYSLHYSYTRAADAPNGSYGTYPTQPNQANLNLFQNNQWYQIHVINSNMENIMYNLLPDSSSHLQKW